MGERERATAGMASMGQLGWGHCCQGVRGRLLQGILAVSPRFRTNRACGEHRPAEPGGTIDDEPDGVVNRA